MIPRTKEEYIANLRANLGSNINWAIAGMKRIYTQQTKDEQSSGSVRYYNSIGFTGTDAKILTSFVDQLKYKNFLSPKQNAIILKKMPKYARQLTEWSLAEGSLVKTERGYEVAK